VHPGVPSWRDLTDSAIRPKLKVMGALPNVAVPAPRPEREFDPPPPGCDLRSYARYLPGGVETMIRLARLSPDEKVRAVALRWLRLPRRIRRKASLESLCAAAGVSDHEFFGEVMATACELGIDALRMLAAPANAARGVQILGERALETGGGGARRKFLESTGFVPREQVDICLHFDCVP
jgi:hypothetical protein